MIDYLFEILFVSYIFSFNQKLTLTHQQMTADYEKLRQEETDKSSKLQELMSVPKHTNTNTNNKYQPKNNKLSQNTSPSHIINCLSPKKTNKHTNNMFLDEFDIDEQNFNKIRKNFFNTNAQYHYDYDNDCTIIDNCKSNSNPNSKSLISTLYRTIPLALPTLQLHLLISLTMVLLTHRCPQYLIVL